MALTTSGPDCELCKLRSIHTADPAGPEGLDWGGVEGRGIDGLTKGLCLAPSLTAKVRKAPCLMILLTQRVQEPPTSPLHQAGLMKSAKLRRHSLRRSPLVRFAGNESWDAV